MKIKTKLLLALTVFFYSNGFSQNSYSIDKSSEEVKVSNKGASRAGAKILYAEDNIYCKIGFGSVVCFDSEFNLIGEKEIEMGEYILIGKEKVVFIQIDASRKQLDILYSIANRNTLESSAKPTLLHSFPIPKDYVQGTVYFPSDVRLKETSEGVVFEMITSTATGTVAPDERWAYFKLSLDSDYQVSDSESKFFIEESVGAKGVSDDSFCSIVKEKEGEKFNHYLVYGSSPFEEEGRIRIDLKGNEELVHHSSCQLNDNKYAVLATYQKTNGREDLPVDGFYFALFDSGTESLHGKIISLDHVQGKAAEQLKKCYLFPEVTYNEKTNKLIAVMRSRYVPYGRIYDRYQMSYYISEIDPEDMSTLNSWIPAYCFYSTFVDGYVGEEYFHTAEGTELLFSSSKGKGLMNGDLRDDLEVRRAFISSSSGELKTDVAFKTAEGESCIVNSIYNVPEQSLFYCMVQNKKYQKLVRVKY